MSKKGFESMEKNINKVLPTDIISDILSRLPAESVLEYKSVCTTWKNLIQHPLFPEMHLACLNSADTGKLRYVFSKPDSGKIYASKHVYCFEYKDDEDWNYVKPMHQKIMFDVDQDYVLIGSFNGLICVYGAQDTYVPEGPAIIFNPVTKRYIVLPKFDSYLEYEDICYEHLACGFGYLAVTNEYKVVRIYRCAGEPNVVEVEVYTLGNGKGWRHVGKFDFGFKFYTHDERQQGVFLNECLHWIYVKGCTVVVFDLALEKFREPIPPPPMLTHTDVYGREFKKFIVIGVSGGGILYYAVFQFLREEAFDDVWLLMNKNGDNVINEQEEHQLWGWSKVTSLDQKEPFVFTKDGSVLRYDQGNLKVFLSSTSTWVNFNFENFDDISRQLYPHKNTLVSMKEFGEKDAEIMKSQEIQYTDSSE